MKKVLSLIMALALVLCAVSALAEGETFLGLGIATSIGSSSDATAEKDGNAQVDSAIVSVVVDKDGVIVSCKIDAAQTKVGFNATGALTADKDAAIKSKKEKQDEYNMRGASPIGKEWFEQISALEQWLVGKTAADLKTAYEGKDESLVTVCSIKLESVCVALEKAVADALAK